MGFQTEAVVLEEIGGPEKLGYHSLTLDWPANAGDVLVRLSCASVNPADIWFRSLGPYLGDGRGAVLGHDGAGVVQAVGEGVTGFAPGDRVCFCNGGLGGDPGTYARHAVVPARLLARIPDGVSTEAAGAFPLVFITGWEALVERAGVRPGDRVLIHGGAGGTGHIAIQIARGLGARVATTVSSSEKAGFVRSLGAEKVIDYRKDDFVNEVLEWTGGAGVRVVLDNAGPEVFQASLRALAPYGHLVTLMGMPADLADGTAYNRNLSIHNVMMLTPMWQGLEDHRDRQAAILREGLNWLADGRLRVDIRARFPLDQSDQAHALQETGGGTGKILLIMPPGTATIDVENARTAS